MAIQPLDEQHVRIGRERHLKIVEGKPRSPWIKLGIIILALAIALAIGYYYKSNIYTPSGWYRHPGISNMLIPNEVPPDIASEVASHYRWPYQGIWKRIRYEEGNKVVFVWTIVGTMRKDRRIIPYFPYFHRKLVEQELAKLQTK